MFAEDDALWASWQGLIGCAISLYYKGSQYFLSYKDGFVFVYESWRLLHQKYAGSHIDPIGWIVNVSVCGYNNEYPCSRLWFMMFGFEVLSM